MVKSGDIELLSMKNSHGIFNDVPYTKNTAEVFSSINVYLSSKRPDDNTSIQSDFTEALIHCLRVVLNLSIFPYVCEWQDVVQTCTPNP